METIAFYSYKGGVGRSLLVANAARFLGMLGKGVVALDLDVEAPGLHYKLGPPPDPRNKTVFTGGAVPYLVATAKGAKDPPPLQEHMVKLALPEGAAGWLQLMPAGPAPRTQYWTALKQLRERLRFDEPSGKGLAALLDLHARLEDELKPDYLLIDSRTGVTELGGLATTALADCVVCLLVPNQESVDGTLAIVEALKASSQRTGRGPIRIVPVAARIAGGVPQVEGRTSEGIDRLVEIAEGRTTNDKKDFKILALPHDSAVGATGKVVGGDQNASAFSVLHKAHLELFQHLFPQERKEAEDVLHRLEAIAELKQRLTERRRGGSRSGAGGGFAPWAQSAIEEGVAIESRQRSAMSRYADLVCRGSKGEPLLIAEYIPENKRPEALEFWSEHSRARCLILLCRKESDEPHGSGWTEEEIYSRPDSWGEKLEPADQHDPPAPMEFEIYKNPGMRLIDELLQAVHSGKEDLVAEVIAQWQGCMAMSAGPMGRGQWRPVEARKILDGLAATESIETAVQILWRAAAASFPGWDVVDFGDFHHLNMGYGGSTLAALSAEELFAPLLWRLPVEAACRYLGEPIHPGWLPCLAGYRLLAEEVMGLRYDPVRSSLEDAESAAAQVPDDEAGDDEDDRKLRIVHWRLFHGKPVRLCEDPPPLLLWEEKLRKDHYWSGELEGLDQKTRDNAKKLMAKESQLRGWIRERINGDTLVTGSLLGRYDPVSGHIELYSAVLDALAPLLELQPRYLKGVVFIQLAVWAMEHQAHDCDGQPGFGFAAASAGGPFQRESPAHVAISQYFAFRLIERLGDVHLMGALEKLSEKQPEPYGRWRRMQHIPIERMRAALLQARSGESALGLPGTEPD